jgi:Uma2 family endonuclease
VNGRLATAIVVEAERDDETSSTGAMDMAVSRPHHRFTVDEYERMGEVGILREDDRVELIRGEIVQMSPIGARHVACLRGANRACYRQLGDDVFIHVQDPIRLPQDGEPQPDLALVRPTYDQARVPSAGDVFLVVEVADPSLEYDRGVKLPLYAEAGIPEAWLFNLIANRIERHTDPGAGGYRTVVFAEEGQLLPSTVLPVLVFDASELLGLQRPTS